MVVHAYNSITGQGSGGGEVRQEDCPAFETSPCYIVRHHFKNENKKQKQKANTDNKKPKQQIGPLNK